MKLTEIQNLSEEHSASLEKKISTLMAELYEQKQESLRKRDEEHELKILAIEDERRKATCEKEAEWIGKNNQLQEEVDRYRIRILC